MQYGINDFDQSTWKMENSIYVKLQPLEATAHVKAKFIDEMYLCWSKFQYPIQFEYTAFKFHRLSIRRDIFIFYICLVCH